MYSGINNCLRHSGNKPKCLCPEEHQRAQRTLPGCTYVSPYLWYLGPDNHNVPDYFYFGQVIGVPLDISLWTANEMIVDGSAKQLKRVKAPL